MSRLEWPGSTLLAPVPPVLVTCGGMDKPNVCTAAWCGVVNSKPPVTYISLRKERYSHEIISQTGEFVLNLPTTALVHVVDWCGVKSGRDQDKFAACGLHTLPAFQVGAPLLAESPLALECKVRRVEPLGSHDLFLADIVAVAVDETLVDEAGKLHLARAGLLAYAHGEYFALGESLGTFGFSVRKKP